MDLLSPFLSIALLTCLFVLLPSVCLGLRPQRRTRHPNVSRRWRSVTLVRSLLVRCTPILAEGQGLKAKAFQPATLTKERKMDQQEIGILKAELRQFTGSEVAYVSPLFNRFRYTEGVQYLAEKSEGEIHHFSRWLAPGYILC